MLRAFPVDLNGLYKHLLLRIKMTADKTKRILKWVLFAPRPMKVEELAIAYAVQLHYKSVSCIDDSLITGFPQCISLCGPILMIKDGLVHLVHQSAKARINHIRLTLTLTDET
jgi:hypothetical protein